MSDSFVVQQKLGTKSLYFTTIDRGGAVWSEGDLAKATQFASEINAQDIAEFIAERAVGTWEVVTYATAAAA